LEKCLGQLFSMNRLEGTGSLAFSVNSTGGNAQELAGNLNGTAQAAPRAGALDGLKVGQVMRGAQPSPIPSGGASATTRTPCGDARTGRTPYDKANVSFRIAQGLATIEDVGLEGPSVVLALTGTTSIPAREFNLTGRATLIGGAPPDPNAMFELPFSVRGQWGS